MADSLKLLVTTPAHRSPAANTPQAVYTVPVGATAMLSRIMVANRNNASATFRIALVESGGSINVQHYIAYDITIGANDSITIPVGAGLATGDSIIVSSNSGFLTFTPMGIEVTA